MTRLVMRMNSTPGGSDTSAGDAGCDRQRGADQRGGDARRDIALHRCSGGAGRRGQSTRARVGGGGATGEKDAQGGLRRHHRHVLHVVIRGGDGGEHAGGARE
eukprot:7364834-Prymnesium_polylepis.1